MSKEITVSTQVTEELASQLDQLSESLGRSRSWIIQEALATYIANEKEFLESVQEGLQDLKEGNVVDHSEVVADWLQRKAIS